jgi:hypothetical protein
MKKLPEHIQPRWNPDNLQWGMWNARLHSWCGKDEFFGHTVYSSKEEAIQRYLENF